MHAPVSEDDGDTCLECGVHVEGVDTVVATRTITVGNVPMTHDFTSGDLAPRCTGVRYEGDAHHFVPTVDGIECAWCQAVITPDTDHAQVPTDCIRP